MICNQILKDKDWLTLHQQGSLDNELEGKNYVIHSSLNEPIQYVMSNSFAFGGSNISLIFGTQLK